MKIRRGEQVVFWDDISDDLKKFSASKQVTSDVVGAVAYAYKQGAREANARTFTQHSGKYQKSIWFKMKKNALQAKLFGGQLSAIYEHNGAYIMPGEGSNGSSGKQALSNINTIVNHPGATPIITRGDVYIPPRPWFYDAIRRLRDSGVADRAADQQLAWELIRGGLK